MGNRDSGRCSLQYDVALSCLSRSSVGKFGFVQKEIRFALDVAEEKPEGTIFLIPVRLEDCKVPSRLMNLEWVNLYEDKGYQRLIQSLHKCADERRNYRELIDGSG